MEEAGIDDILDVDGRECGDWRVWIGEGRDDDKSCKLEVVGAGCVKGILGCLEELCKSLNAVVSELCLWLVKRNRLRGRKTYF